MIISDKNKYIFIELPHTGSTAISKELCENYDGRNILSKHSKYHQFLKIATEEQKKYFTFSCIRNPLDEALTLFYRYKTNHDNRYTTPSKWKRNGGSVSDYSLKTYNFIKNNDADFPVFIKWFYRRPYDNWSNLAHNNFDYIVYFENIQNGFSKVLELNKIKQIRPIPVTNKTRKRDSDFWSYYTSDIYNYVIEVFGPFMQEWGYDFPKEWGEIKISKIIILKYYFYKRLRQISWKYSD